MRMNTIAPAAMALAFVAATGFAQTTGAPPSGENTVEKQGMKAQEFSGESVKGTVAAVNPTMVVLNTDDGRKEFNITSETINRDTLTPDKYVEVWYEPAAEGERPTLVGVKVAEGDQATESAAGTDEQGESVTGTVVAVDPTMVVLTTEEGQREFGLTDETKDRDVLAVGIPVTVWYVTAAEGERPELMAVAEQQRETTGEGETVGEYNRDQARTLNTDAFRSDAGAVGFEGPSTQGRVVSSDNDLLVLETDSGRSEFSLTDQTQGRDAIVEGRDVEVWTSGEGERRDVVAVRLVGADRTADASTGVSGSAQMGDTEASAGAELSARADEQGVSGSAELSADATDVEGAQNELEQDQPAAGEASGFERDTIATDAEQSEIGAARDQFADNRSEEQFGDQTERLPQTGTSLPLIGLIGLLMLAGALAIRHLR